jgi:hypothetical protein
VGSGAEQQATDEATSEERMLYDRLDGSVLFAERRLGRATWPLIGALCFGLAALYVPPSLSPLYLGEHYAEQSRHPFAFAGRSPIGFRILTPAIAWLVGLRGELLIVANWAIAAAFLAAVGSYFRRVTKRPADALLAVVILASSTVTLVSVLWGYYCDSTTYLIVFGMWMTRGRPIFYALFLLGLLNHESVAFLVPWFVVLALVEIRPFAPALRVQAVGYVAAFAIYFGFRAWVSSRMYVGFDLAYYLAPLRQDLLSVWRLTSGTQAIGALSVFKALWLVPAAAAVLAVRRRLWGSLASWVVLIACVWAQLLFAYDTTRVFTLAFPLMIVALEALYRTEDFGFRRWLPALVLLNLAIRPFFVVKNIVWVPDSLPVRSLAWLADLF